MVSCIRCSGEVNIPCLMHDNNLCQMDVKMTITGTGWLCLTSNRQRGHLETVPPFTVPCDERFYTVPTENRTQGRGVGVHYTTAAPRQLYITYTEQIRFKYKICYDVKQANRTYVLSKRPDTRSFIATGWWLMTYLHYSVIHCGEKKCEHCVIVLYMHHNDLLS